MVTQTAPRPPPHAEYTTREELVLRRAVFASNVAKIETHNAEAAAGKHTWTMGVNKFADQMPEEFSVSRNGSAVLIDWVVWVPCFVGDSGEPAEPCTRD